MARFCVQCHHLPSPAMHHPDKWPKIVDRMVVRMRGSGNRGALMKDMMGGVAAPDEEEVHMLIGYLRRNAQKPINPARYPDLATRGRSFRDACDQCHVLPEPSSRPAAEWRRVVKRMEDNMTWMNRVVGSRAVPGEPQLRPDDIVPIWNATPDVDAVRRVRQTMLASCDRPVRTRSAAGSHSTHVLHDRAPVRFQHHAVPHAGKYAGF
jgi:hypothetical protein